MLSKDEHLERVELSEEDLIASGAYCRCFRHPSRSELCVKIPTDDQKAPKRLRGDLSYYRELHRKRVRLDHISDYLGVCETSLGKGYVYERVVDFDGKTSRRLSDYLKTQPERYVEISASLYELSRYLVDNEILISDVHGRNILLQEADDGSFVAKFVDGLGDRVLFPFLNWIPALRRRKCARRWNRFVDSLGRKYPSLEIEKVYL